MKINKMCLPNRNIWNVPVSATAMLPRIVEVCLEYPIWVSIKRTLMGKLAINCRNINYFVRLKKNVIKTLKII